MYLGGNHVRVVCERVWRIAQDCAKKQGLAAGSRGWLAVASRQNDAHVPSMLEAEASRQLLHYRTKVPGWPGRLLVAWTCDSTQSQGQVARTSCLGKSDFSHSFCPYYIYIYPYTHDLERASRENFKRETLEKTKLTHPQSLPKRLCKFLYSLPLYCQILERLITKTFSHHVHSSERAVWCFGKQLGRNQFHIGWCCGQVVESEKLEKK